MNDFDFEELDKAVTNLATKAQDEHGGPDPAQSPKVTIIPASAAAPISVAAKSEPTPTVSSPTVPPVPVVADEPAEIKSTSAPAKHRLSDTRTRGRGSFMDIVPPSPRKTPTRVGVSVQPVSKAEEIVPDAKTASNPEPDELLKGLNLDLDTKPTAPNPEASSNSTPVEAPQPKPAEPESAPEQSADSKKSDVAWPDPLDFGTAEAESAKTDKPAEAESTEPVSPFLAEAKVEKRPLGAFSNFKPAVEPKPEPPKPVEEPKKSEDELTPQTDGTFEEPEKQKAPLPPKEGEKPEEKEPAKPDLHGAAMMAIPDQYRPEPKATDKTTRPVYDTKEYHPPLVEAAGHHEHRGGGSMWGKIFVALVALALIAVAGYFAYIYFVQQ